MSYTAVLPLQRPLTAVKYKRQDNLDRPMKFLVLKHAAHEGLGRYMQFAREKGIELQNADLWKHGYRIPEATEYEDYDAAIIMGGSQGVNDSIKEYPSKEEEAELIRHFPHPILGHCLGSQLGTYALGGQVRRGDKQECGFYTLSVTPNGQKTIFKGFPKSFPVFQWHGDYISKLPKDAVLLAGSEYYENQAFLCYNEAGAPVIGVLFHPEMDSRAIYQLFEADNKWFLHGNHGNTREQVMSEAKLHDVQLQGLSRILFENFVSLVEEHGH